MIGFKGFNRNRTGGAAYVLFDQGQFSVPIDNPGQYTWVYESNWRPATIVNNEIYINTGVTPLHATTFGSSGEIDITRYSRMCVEHLINQEADTKYGMYVVNEKVWYPDGHQQVAKVNLRTSADYTITRLDISSVVGSYYLAFMCGADTGRLGYIRRWWLE